MLLDGNSRRCIGWSLGRTLGTELTLEAFRMALAKARRLHWCIIPIAACNTRPETTRRCWPSNGIAISMSRKASPNDNAKAESFIKTLYEEVYAVRLRELRRGAAGIEEFIERVYNEKRLHSALDYRPPIEYEQMPLLNQQTPQEVAGCRFLRRHREIYRSDGLYSAFVRVGREAEGSTPRPIVSAHEFPAGYSLGGLRSRRARFRFTSSSRSLRMIRPYRPGQAFFSEWGNPA